MIFAIGSTSHIKINALLMAFPDSIIYPIDVRSRIPEQPRGKEETLKGAKFRAMDALAECSEPIDWAIGIESGMWDGVDGAAIVCIAVPSGKEYIAWSEELTIPPDHPPGPMGRWSKMNDPHQFISGKSRSQYLAEAIKKIIFASSKPLQCSHNQDHL